MEKFLSILALVIFSSLFSCEPKDIVDKKEHNCTPENDTFSLINGEGPYELAFLANDKIEGVPEVVVKTPFHGSVKINKTQSSNLAELTLKYFPDTGFIGLDSIEYTVCIDQVCKTATIFISISDTTTEPDPKPDDRCSQKDTLLLNQFQKVSINKWLMDRTSNDCGFQWSVGKLEILSQPVHGEFTIFNNETMYTVKKLSQEVRYDYILYKVCMANEQCLENQVIIKIYP